MINALNSESVKISIDLQDLLGMGGEGAVYKATSSRYDEPITAKRQKVGKRGFPPIFSSLLASLFISAKTTKCNKHIMCLLGTVLNPKNAPTQIMDKLPNFKKNIFLSEMVAEDECYLLYEYIEGQDLKKRIQDPEPFDVKKYCEQLLSTLVFLHGKSVVHLDIKPQNIMVTKDDDLKIVDFGFLCLTKEKSCVRPGASTEYAAPEIFLRAPDKNHLYTSDVFALGLTMYEIISRKEGMPGKKGLNFAKTEDELDLDFTKETEKWKPLISAMVLRDLTKRPTAKEALELFLKVGGKRRQRKTRKQKQKNYLL